SGGRAEQGLPALGGHAREVPGRRLRGVRRRQEGLQQARAGAFPCLSRGAGADPVTAGRQLRDPGTRDRDQVEGVAGPKDGGRVRWTPPPNPSTTSSSAASRSTGGASSSTPTSCSTAERTSTTRISPRAT